jgi:formylmethanofuran dehydrogenase subunit B
MPIPAKDGLMICDAVPSVAADGNAVRVMDACAFERAAYAMHSSDVRMEAMLKEEGSVDYEEVAVLLIQLQYAMYC